MRTDTGYKSCKFALFIISITSIGHTEQNTSGYSKHFQSNVKATETPEGLRYMCQICGKVTKYRSGMIQHLRRHGIMINNQRTLKGFHKCRHCPMKFKHPFLLTNHILRVHTGMPLSSFKLIVRGFASVPFDLYTAFLALINRAIHSLNLTQRSHCCDSCDLV